MSDTSLTEIAAELYSAAPEEFVAARNARAADAADREDAARIRALKKPSVAAWVVNVFAHERADRLGQALQLAAELREAQDQLDAATLAELGRRRRALTSQLAHEAGELASARGGRVSPSTLEAVRQTIAAAFFDPDAAVAVASGRLVRELEASGDPVDLDV
ncbi:MAG TPA: transposase, partial [Microbacterium sp.]|nr:transposase [Microbacterium sp.]